MARGCLKTNNHIAVENLSIGNLIAIIREFHAISDKTEILAHSLIEADLGVTGDDGSELLAHLEETFKVNFELSDFDLKIAQYLFQSEGFNLFSASFSDEMANKKDISVNCLHKAITHAFSRKNTTPF